MNSNYTYLDCYRDNLASTQLVGLKLPLKHIKKVFKYAGYPLFRQQTNKV